MAGTCRLALLLAVGALLCSPSSAAPSETSAQAAARRGFLQCYGRYAKRKQKRPWQGAVLLGQRCLQALSTWQRAPVKYIVSLHDSQGRLQLRLKQYSRAVPHFQKALALRETHQGPGHKDSYTARDNLILALRKSKRPREVMALLQRQLQLLRRAQRPDRDLWLKSLNNLAFEHQRMGHSKHAIKLYRRAFGLLRRWYHRQYHRSYRHLYGNLGSLYSDMGRYKQAIETIRALVAYTRKHYGLGHRHTAQAHTRLGHLYGRIGHYNKALRQYQRARAILVKQSRPDTRQIADILGRLGSVYVDLGDHRRARRLLERSAAMKRALYGRHHENYARALNNLGTLYASLDEYGKAYRMYQRAIAIAARLPRASGFHLSHYQQNLALLLTKLGRSQEALALYKQVYAAQRKRRGKAHISQSMVLFNMGTLYQRLARKKMAHKLFQQVLALHRKAYGADSPKTAMILRQLGGHYVSMGQYERALPLLQEALATSRRRMGPRSHAVALSLTSLAHLYAQMGRATKALQLYQQSVALTRSLWGPRSRPLITARLNLALQRLGLAIHARRHKLYHAVKGLLHIKRAWRIQLALLPRIFALSSRKQRRRYLATIRMRRYLILSLPRHPALSRVQEVLRFAFVTSLQTKAMLSRLLRLQQRRPRRPTSRPSRTKHPRSTNQRSPAFRRSRNTSARPATRPISRQAPHQIAHRLQRLHGSLSVKAMRRQLRPGQVLIEFVRHWAYRFHRTGNSAHWNRHRYAAYILRRDQPLRRIELGRAASLDRLLDAYHAQLTQPGRDAKAAFRRLQRAARPLYKALWQPLQPHLQGVQRIYVSPDGPLWRLPLEALLGPKDRYLVERYGFVYLSSGADLLELASRRRHRVPRHALLFANPDFGRGGTQPFAPLPGTAAELRMVRRLLRQTPWTARSFQRAQATSSQLQRQLTQQPPALLHLATHAFFYRRRRPRAARGQPLTRAAKPRRGFPRAPFQRSGLALAGANDPRGQGRLTALQLLAIPLHQTQLAVLSACETGRGTTLHWEGVVGLRSAFQQAGVGALILSLWKIPDRSTYYLMRDFYRNLLQRRMPRYRSFREAQRSTIQRLRRRWGRAHPYFWGAFVFQGATGPLQMARQPTFVDAGWWWDVAFERPTGSPR